VTNFFEIIDVSATHVYHSALELSPLSSIVRKLYYSQRPPLPRVITGIPDSWDPCIVSVSTDDSGYLSSTWSPCNQFVAAVAREVLEIRDASTLKLFSTIQSIKVGTKFRQNLAYSPDGRSLAIYSDLGIMILDIQTGGVVGKIACGIIDDGFQLAWSLDGMTIGTISRRESETPIVCIYEVVSGAIQSSSIVQSTGTTHIWAHDKSFRVMAGTKCLDGWVINIFEAGATLTKVKQFPIGSRFSLGVFCPTTYRISAFVARDFNNDSRLLVLDIRGSEALLRETGSYRNHSFSPDGTFFAAFAGVRLLIWRYTPGRYTRWREFQQTATALQFSPSSSSILGRAGTRLHVFHLDHPPASLAVGSTVKARGQLHDAFSSDGTYIVTAHHGESTVTVTNLNSPYPSPSQFIDTDLEILAMILTGNVLLVEGPEKIVAWLLTKEGMVDGIFGDTRAGRNDSLWDVPTDTLPARWLRLSRPKGENRNRVLEFSAEGGTAAIALDGFNIRVYNTRTGEILKMDDGPRRTWYRFHHPHRDECDLYHRDLLKHRGPLEHDWQLSQTTLRGGWVTDPEGKRRLWLHVRWRSPQTVDWLHNGTTMRFKTSSELVVIKF
jgi:WD40 repeat protein